MHLSPAERSYLSDSLRRTPALRPDGRKPWQFRPLEAKTGFFPGSNGSARIRLTDGSECIVSVKTKVVLIAREPNLVECDVDVLGYRDDLNFIANLKFALTDLYLGHFPTQKLHLTSKYAFKLYVDCIVVSHHSHPLSLITFAAYLALRTTRLPLLISDVDDSEVEEQPTFSDDWEQAKTLAEIFRLPSFQPPVIITAGIVGSSIIADPSETEEQVLENGFLFGWYNNTVILPITNVNLATNSNNSDIKSFSPVLFTKTVAFLKEHCTSLIAAFDELLDAEETEEDGSIF